MFQVPTYVKFITIANTVNQCRGVPKFVCQTTLVNCIGKNSVKVKDFDFIIPLKHSTCLGGHFLIMHRKLITKFLVVAHYSLYFDT